MTKPQYNSIFTRMCFIGSREETTAEKVKKKKRPSKPVIVREVKEKKKPRFRRTEVSKARKTIEAVKKKKRRQSIKQRHIVGIHVDIA